MTRTRAAVVLLAIYVVTEVVFVTGCVSAQTFVEVFGISKQQLGIFFGTFNVGWLFASLLAGYATDRRGPFATLIAGLAGSLGGIALLAGAANYGMLLAGAIAVSVTTAFAYNANATLLAELHGRCGYFPAQLRLRPVPGSLPPRFEIAEVLNLQALRDAARERRSDAPAS